MMGNAQATRMDWRRDAVTLGRLIAVAVIVLGSALATWNAIDVGENDETLRNLIRQILLFLWYGGLVLLVAEIVGAVRGDGSQDGMVNWQIPLLIGALAGTILFGGTALTIWDIQAKRDLPDFLASNFLPTQSELTTSESIRYFLEQELQTYLWQSGLLVLLAALADRLGWRAAGDASEENGQSDPAL